MCLSKLTIFVQYWRTFYSFISYLITSKYLAGTTHVQSTVKWADIEKGIPPEEHGK